MTPVSSEMLQMVGNGGFIIALVWAVRYLATQSEARNRELVDTLRGVVESNTIALLKVESVLRNCRGNNHTELVTRHETKTNHP